MKGQQSQIIAKQKAPFYHIEVAQKAFAKELVYPTKYKRRARMLPNNDPRKGELLRRDREQVARMKPKNAARQEILRDLLERLTHTVVANTEIVHGENGEAFPVSHVNITKFARFLYTDSCHGSCEIPPIPHDEQGYEWRSSGTHNIVEFNFPSAPTEQNGHPFTFIEEVMKQTMNRLPRIFKDIREGKQPQEILIYQMGTPTNRDWGYMPPEYAAKVKGAPYASVGHTYADYIQSVLDKYSSDRRHTSVLFYGISMGAAYAAKTAEELLGIGTVTQQQDKDLSIDLPSLYILLDSPVAFNNMNINGKQLTLLFLKDVTFNFMFRWNFSLSKKQEGIFNPKVLFTPVLENLFLTWLDTQLRQRGIYRVGEQSGAPGDAELKKQQHQLKQEALRSLVHQMAEGVPLDPCIKMNIRRGTKDTLESSNTYDGLEGHRNWRGKAEARLHTKETTVSRSGQEVAASSTLGANLIRTNAPNIREGAIANGHVIPFFNRGEMRKWVCTVNTILALDNKVLNEQSCYRAQRTSFIRQHFARVPFLERVFARHFC
jgi:hypothetical protein